MKEKYDILKLENQICFPIYAVSNKIVSYYLEWRNIICQFMIIV